MKRWTAVILCLCLVFLMAACGSNENEPSASVSQPSADTEAVQPEQDITEDITEEIAEPQEDDTTDTTDTSSGESKVLIAYFTWAENTVVENPDEVDVDADTSASVLPPGNAAKIAGWIRERTGGELFSIVVTEPYSSDYDECLDRAADEKAENARPELVNHIENMEDYDTVFIGFPNWWYTVPMAIHSFLEEYDFSGKTVIPFVTHGTGGLASTIEDMTDTLPDSVDIREPIGVYRPEVDESQPDVNAWLDALGY